MQKEASFPRRPCEGILLEDSGKMKFKSGKDKQSSGVVAANGLIKKIGKECWWKGCASIRRQRRRGDGRMSQPRGRPVGHQNGKKRMGAHCWLQIKDQTNRSTPLWDASNFFLRLFLPFCHRPESLLFLPAHPPPPLGRAYLSSPLFTLPRYLQVSNRGVTKNFAHKFCILTPELCSGRYSISPSLSLSLSCPYLLFLIQSFSCFALSFFHSLRFSYSGILSLFVALSFCPSGWLVLSLSFSHSLPLPCSLVLSYFFALSFPPTFVLFYSLLLSGPLVLSVSVALVLYC